MLQIYIEKPSRLMRNKKLIEKELNVKIQRKGDIFYINSKPEDEYLVADFFEAINLDFGIQKALSIKEGAVFTKINIKDVKKISNPKAIRARIIGKHGKAIETLENLTHCYIKLKDNTVGIIGMPEDIEKAEFAINRLTHGTKHGNIYAHLEKQNSDEKKHL
jgi:rRNA processing protein Krr1/Pno1